MTTDDHHSVFRDESGGLRLAPAMVPGRAMAADAGGDVDSAAGRPDPAASASAHGPEPIIGALAADPAARVAAAVAAARTAVAEKDPRTTRTAAAAGATGFGTGRCVLPAPEPDPAIERATRACAPPGWLDAVRSLKKSFGLTDAERASIALKNKTIVQPPPPGTGNSVGAVSKIIMRGMNTMHLYRMDAFYAAVEARESGLGLLTVSNHRSVADDPVMLAAMLPPRILVRPRLMRWGLCSADICFQERLTGRLLSLGKALPVLRTGGVGQRYITDAAAKLASGDWIHVFPEGRVVQASLGYMKRGVGRMLAIYHERNNGGLPLVLPLYHEGVENVMPQNSATNELLGMMPRVGHNVYAIAGDPVDVRDIFEKHMPACAKAGGTRTDPRECMFLYEQLADRLAMSVRLLRAELRMRVRTETGVFLGDPFETT
jgi:monolysocardiolipin acyltransferase